MDSGRHESDSGPKLELDQESVVVRETRLVIENHLVVHEPHPEAGRQAIEHVVQLLLAFDPVVPKVGVAVGLGAVRVVARAEVETVSTKPSDSVRKRYASEVV